MLRVRQTRRNDPQKSNEREHVVVVPSGVAHIFQPFGYVLHPWCRSPRQLLSRTLQVATKSTEKKAM
jgi:hypothetical protein